MRAIRTSEELPPDLRASALEVDPWSVPEPVDRQLRATARTSPLKLYWTEIAQRRVATAVIVEADCNKAMGRIAMIRQWSRHNYHYGMRPDIAKIISVVPEFGCGVVPVRMRYLESSGAEQTIEYRSERACCSRIM